MYLQDHTLTTPQGAHRPARAPYPSNYLPALRDLASPVLDLASTLTYDPEDWIAAEDYINADNVSFLRTETESPDEIPTETLAQELRHERRPREMSYEERRMQYRRQRSDTHWAWADRMINRAPLPHGNRVPSRQSLYDWAPATEEGDEQELDDILDELREQRPDASPEVLRLLSQAHMDAEREMRTRGSSARQQPGGHGSQYQEPSLRSAAILQSVRRNQRFSPRSRNLMQRYVMERERSQPENAERHEPSSSRWFRASANPHESSRYEQNRIAWQASQGSSGSSGLSFPQREPPDSLRRRYLQDPANKPTAFEKVIKYLKSIRSPDHAPSPPEYRNCAGVGIVQDIAGLSPPASSWLVPGSVFSGLQQAACAPSSSTTLHRLANSHSMISTGVDPTVSLPSNDRASLPWLSQNLTASPSITHSTIPIPSSALSSRPCQDRWTVKVIIHDVDWDAMTLQGTMEACNVTPANLSPTTISKTTISTYMEGEIIDFRRHTLVTESFPATSDVDATYWRKLPPFKDMTEEDLSVALLFRPDELLGKYVLMRWKERCFVKPTYNGLDSRTLPPGTPMYHRNHGAPSWASFQASADGNGYGLSISGFYYVSLRRTDGKVEALYFDPQTSPYQHLELSVEGAGMFGNGVWEFR